MKVAVLADIHSNLHALRAVLDVLEQHPYDQLVVLGDIVGYNAAPNQCVAEVRKRADVVVVGNHDVDALSDEAGVGTNNAARLAQQWTRSKLTDESAAYLHNLPRIEVLPDHYVAVHGCYLNDRHYCGYVTSTMLPRNLETIAGTSNWPQLAMCGHTHSPMIGWPDGPEPFESDLAEAVTWPADARAVLVNPGAVGQPRDGDPRAAFALVDTTERRAEVHRVGYDVEGAARAVVCAGLPELLAERLREGR